MNILRLKTFVVFCAFVLLAVTQAFAQNPDVGVGEDSNPLNPTPPRSQVLVGPVLGLTRNFHTGGFRTIDEPNCPVFEQGGGWGFLAGMTAEFQFGQTWSIIPRIMYEQRPGQFDQTLPDVLVLLTNEPEPVNQTVSTSSSITYNLLSVEVLYKQEFAQIGKGLRFAAAVGPAFNYIMSGTINQTQDLEEPQNARFVNPTHLPTANNGRQLIFADNLSIFDATAFGSNASTTRFSLKAGLQAEVGLFKNAWIMTPGVYYDYGLTDVTSTESWQLNSIIFMVDFRRAF